jgi:septation ring formation regulator EzrA
MAVHRSRWTDERLDDLAQRVMRQDVLEVRFDSLERRFDDLERRFEDFRAEMREFRAEMRDFRRESTADVHSLRSELYATKRWMMTMWLTGVLAFIAVFVEISLRG